MSARTDPKAFFDLLNDEGPITHLSRQQITLSTFNPRRLLGGDTEFSNEALQDLTESIRLNGIMQPLLVRPLGVGEYELVAGERRYHAAGLAGLNDLPVLVRSMTQAQAEEFSILENTQRQALRPDVLGLLAIRSVAALCHIPTEQVLTLANRLKNGETDSYDVAGHLRRLYRMSISSFAQRYAKAALLSPDERMALIDGRFGLPALLPLTRIADSEQRAERLQQLLTGRCTAAQLAQEVRAERAASQVLSPERQLKAALPKVDDLQGEAKSEARRLIQALLALIDQAP